MADTPIEWTDVVWNPTTGCDRVSSGCDNCYALTMAKRLKGMEGKRIALGLLDPARAKYQADGDPRTSGPGFGVAIHPQTLDEPYSWRQPRKVFVNSMSDLFHARVPVEFIQRVFAVMADTPQHTYQVLTKRASRLPKIAHLLDWPPNVWLGTSVENARVLHRVDDLRKVPAEVRFLSCEPLLGPLPGLDLSGIGWVIGGGESGPKARPMHPDWVRSLRDRCVAAGVPFFFKQHGEWAPIGPLYGDSDDVEDAHTEAVHLEVHEGRQVIQMEPDGSIVDPQEYQPGLGTWLMAKVGKKAAGRRLDGRTWDEFPERAA